MIQTSNTEPMQCAEQKERPAHLWKSGRSGNPLGKSSTRVRREWLRRGLAEALGGVEHLTVDQRTLLELTVEQTIVVERSRGSERTRAANVLLRLRAQLGLGARDRKPERSDLARAILGGDE